MKTFPTRELEFLLNDDPATTLKRLKRRTDHSTYLTEKSFRGIINGYDFKLISSSVGKGAFCVMTGNLSLKKGKVQVNIHKVFKGFLSLFMMAPIIAISIGLILNLQKFALMPFLITIGQVFFIRYVFIELLFRWLSRQSLNRLRDVLDLEWISTQK
jgi:hypothetical protein